jgi:hypothetical protein
MKQLTTDKMETNMLLMLRYGTTQPTKSTKAKLSYKAISKLLGVSSYRITKKLE